MADVAARGRLMQQDQYVMLDDQYESDVTCAELRCSIEPMRITYVKFQIKINKVITQEASPARRVHVRLNERDASVSPSK